MSKKFENKHSENPNALTAEDREVLEKKTITPADINDALHDKDMARAITTSARSSETGFRLILGIFLVISGIFIAVMTSVTIVGIILGALFVIGGMILPFTNLGAGRRHSA